MECRHWDEGAQECKNQLLWKMSNVFMTQKHLIEVTITSISFDNNCSASKDAQKMRRRLSYWSVGLDSIVRSNLL